MARWVACAVSRSVSAARRPSVSVSWSVLVISTDIPGGGDTVSSRAASVAARARSYRARAARTLVCAFFLAGLGTIPVSYTHLRAHETVLDLVCRLLLEK